MKTSQQNEI